MPRSNVPSRSRAISHRWPRVAVLALVAVVVAGCSDSARFDSNPYASNARQAPSPDVTGPGVAAAGGGPGPAGGPPAPGGRAKHEPLRSPSRPATVLASSGVANGAQ